MSREATFLFNNLLLLALAFAVLWGVVFPILSEAVRGVRATVATPVLRLLPRHLRAAAARADRDRPADRVAARVAGEPVAHLPLAGRLGARRGGAASALLGLGSSPAGLTALSLCVFVTVTIGMEFARGTAARRAIAGGSWPRALRDLVNRNRRRYGGYVVHLAIVLLVVGVTASSAYSSVAETNLAVGQSMRIDGYTLKNTGLFQRKGPNYTLDVRAPPGVAGRQGARRRSSRACASTTPARSANEVDIRSSLTTGTDLYSILQAPDRNGSRRVGSRCS